MSNDPPIPLSLTECRDKMHVAGHYTDKAIASYPDMVTKALTETAKEVLASLMPIPHPTPDTSLIEKLEKAKSNWKGLPVPTAWEQGRDAGFREAFTIVREHQAEHDQSLNTLPQRDQKRRKNEHDASEISDAENLVGEAYQLAGRLAFELPKGHALESQAIRLMDILAYHLPDALENTQKPVSSHAGDAPTRKAGTPKGRQTSPAPVMGAAPSGLPDGKSTAAVAAPTTDHPWCIEHYPNKCSCNDQPVDPYCVHGELNDVQCPRCDDQPVGRTYHPAAFINSIREEGTKEEACRFLQETWNELCELKASMRSMKRKFSKEDAALAQDLIREQLPSMPHHSGDPTRIAQATGYATAIISTLLDHFEIRRRGSDD